MKKTVSLAIITLIAIILSINAYAMHDSLPKESWSSSIWDSLKKEDVCRCFSGIDNIIERRNPKIDAPTAAKLCIQFCTHCEPKVKGTNENEVQKCLQSGFIRGAKDIALCLDSASKSTCKNELSIIYEEPKYEPPKIERKTSLPPEQKKEMPVQKITITEENCRTISQNLLYKIGLETYCKNEFTQQIFIDALKREFSSQGREREDFELCSPVIWDETYRIARKICPSEAPKPAPKKEEALPLVPKEYPKKEFPWLIVLLSITGIIILAGAIAGIIHVVRKHKEIKELEARKEMPQEIKEVKEAIQEVQNEVVVPPVYEVLKQKQTKKARSLSPEEIKKFKFEK